MMRGQTLFNTSHYFSNAVATYDTYALIQNQAASLLFEQLSSLKPPSRILDIGCGTGRHTLQLATRFPTSTIIACDTAPDMIHYAQAHHAHPNISYHTTSFVTSKIPYDLIFSNASFQWVSPLDELFGTLRSSLSPQGHILFSCFGPDTYNELATTLSTVLEKPVQLPAQAFADGKALLSSINRSFQQISLEQYRLTQSFESLMALLRTIKYTGTQGHPFQGRQLWTPSLIQRLETTYRDTFGHLQVTYQVFIGQLSLKASHDGA